MVYFPIQKEPKQSKSTIFWIGKYTGCQSDQENGGFHTKWNPILHGLTCRCTSDPNLGEVVTATVVHTIPQRIYVWYIISNIEHLQSKINQNVYRQNMPFVPCIDPTRDWITNNVFFVFFEGRAEGFVSVSFRSQTDQGTSGRWTDSHGAIEFRTSTGGFSGGRSMLGNRVWWNP